MSFSPIRLFALTRKESLQVVRDPSTALIAFVLPVVLLFLFAYAVSLDIKRVPVGVVLECDSSAASSLAAAYSGTRFLKVTPARNRRELTGELVAGSIRAMIIIPHNFEQRLRSVDSEALVQIITDGSQPNTASFVASFAQGVLANWRADRRAVWSGGDAD